MKSTVKFLTIAAMVLLMTAVFVNAQPQPPADDQPADTQAPAPGVRAGGGRMAEKILEDLKVKDPNEAARLEKLREDDPQQFHKEIRELAFKNMPKGEHRGEGMQGMPGRPDRPDRGGRGMVMEKTRQKEAELIAWLTKNEPAEANSLAALKGKDPQAYMRKIMIDMKKYRQIMETEEANPALAEILKKELSLKEQRNSLLEKFKAATGDKQKDAAKEDLKEVVGQLFDVKLQKKQFRYEDLKKKLEELQKNVDKSQAELEKFKTDKDAQVDKYLEGLINQTEGFDWD